MTASYPQDLFTSLLPQWHALLQDWSSSGRLTSAAQEALLLDGEPQALKDLVSQWSSGDFSSIPPIVLLSSADISGAMGAYAISTGTIYLNRDWLRTATQDQVNAVLTEELGHHLDGILNAVDTPGDEGEIFSTYIFNANSDSNHIGAIRMEDDKVSVYSQAGFGIEAEASYALSRGNTTSVNQLPIGERLRLEILGGWLYEINTEWESGGSRWTIGKYSGVLFSSDDAATAGTLASQLANYFGQYSYAVTGNRILINPAGGGTVNFKAVIYGNSGHPYYPRLIAYADTGTASYDLNTTYSVASIASANLLSVDPDGVVSGSTQVLWQASSDQSSWLDISTDIDLSISSGFANKYIRAIISYVDKEGFGEKVTTRSAYILPPVDNGDAVFAITGASTANAPAVGNLLTATNTTADPDGNGTFAYAWQTSSDGTTWSPVGTNSASYTVAATDEGKQIRVGISYTDGQNFSETVTTSAGTVSTLNKAPTPLTLQSTTATNNQLILTFSEDIQIAGGGALNPAYMTVTVDGQARKITRSQILPPDQPSIHTASQLALTLSGRSLDGAQSVSISYNPPPNGTNAGFITDLDGNALASIAAQVVDTYRTTFSISTRGLSSAYKNLILTGSAAAGYGNSLNNTITGNDANNTLDGRAGADNMIGGKGNDTYFVDNTGDVAIEIANEGTDTVQFSIIYDPTTQTPPTYKLIENTENLLLIGTSVINGTGNSANNIITGNTAANILNGDGGTDALIGGKGNDTYIVDSIDDIITESGLRADADSVQSSVSWILGINLENLTLTGSSAINGTGNNLNNAISGNSANNILDGGNGGTDRLTGLEGADIFKFSTRPSSFRNTTADRITDFSSTQGDKIHITKSAFGITESTAALSVVSSAAALNTALSGSALFVYNTANGELHWNQNGSIRGAGSGGVLAILDNKATLTSGDLMLV
jgi:hypothetical protein